MVKSNKQSINGNEPVFLKDTPGRSLIKAVTFRIFGSLATFFVAFVIFRQYTDKGLTDVLEGTTIVTFFDFATKILLYYFHE